MSDPCYHCPLDNCPDCEYQGGIYPPVEPIEGQTDIFEQLEESQ